MGDQRHKALVTRDHGWRNKAQARIFHATKGEAGRQDQQIVAVPAIGAVDILGYFEHGLGVGKFGSGRIEDACFRVDAGSIAHGLELKVANSECDEIGRNWLRHREFVDAILLSVWIIVCAHYRAQFCGCSNRCVVGDAHAGRVLQGHETTCMYRLRLTEQEGVFFARRLNRIQPLQARCFGDRPVANGNRCGVARQVYRERFPQEIIAIDKGECRVLQVVALTRAHRFNDEVARIQNQGIIAVVEAIKVQNHFAFKDFARKIDGQVHIDVPHTVIVRIGERMVIHAWYRPCVELLGGVSFCRNSLFCFRF